jgi:hypothetical protein
LRCSFYQRERLYIYDLTICEVLGALEYFEWVGEIFGAEHAERCAADYTGQRLRFKLGMSTIRSNEFELSRALLDILVETPGDRLRHHRYPSAGRARVHGCIYFGRKTLPPGGPSLCSG